MGPVVILAMSEEDSGNAAARKLHPFFKRTPARGNSHPVQANSKGKRKFGTNECTPHCPSNTPTDVVGQHDQQLRSDTYFLRAPPSHQQTLMELSHASSKGQLVPTKNDSSCTSSVLQPAISPNTDPGETLTIVAPTSVLAASATSTSIRPISAQRATKVLKLNLKTGTLGSPPKPKPAKALSRIVCIKYAQNPEDRERIGNQIEQIIAGKVQIEESASTLTEWKPKKTTEKASQPSSKTTHPFFTKEKRTEKPTSSDKRKSCIFMSTPTQISPKKPRTSLYSVKGPSFGLRSTGVKVPGAKYPLWPTYGFSHVRGEEQKELPAIKSSASRLKKKSKGQMVSIKSEESILGQLSCLLDIEKVKRSFPKNDNTFPPPPAELRLPARHFESGRMLANRMRCEIQADVSRITASKADVDEDDLAHDPSKPVHAAIARHWQSLFTRLSAFDQSTCESASWCTKYAPTTASQVLQPGREVLLLKQWLEMLRVQSVGSASDDSAKAHGDGKRKKRKSKLDDFIVDSEDESGEMNELSDSEKQLPNGKRRLRPSLARSLDLAGKDPSKLANTILISGPHGSGKSASVYAVAKELGFEVFEINSSTRRSGKDILEKVGDMTRNHLVQHRGTSTLESSPVSSEAESKCGKQGTMVSFFKPKTPALRKKKAPRKSGSKTDSGGKGSSSPSQKQSLILVEEADILYEEDKQFWASLQSLMSQSKRPFILTCNDESLVPVHTLNLQGIFRFSPPPVDLAVDVCLLMAANEGHALKRNAVESLYKSRDYDLRGTINDLHFWCQIGVGDNRGGHDWFYLRWPKGIDTDSRGDVVRVVSEDTYLTGMGWLSRDGLGAASTTTALELEAAEQTWRFWRQDLADWHGEQDLEPLAKITSANASGRGQMVAALDAFSDYCDSLSSADICAAGALGLELEEVIDATIPDMLENTRDDYIIGQKLLEAQPAEVYSCSRAAIASSMSALALRSLKDCVGSQLTAGTACPRSQVHNERRTTRMLEKSFESKKGKLTRYDVAVAFDPIAVSAKTVASTSLDASVFDRTMTMIVVEVAPWVRGIVHHDDQLMRDRQRLSDLLGEGSRRKRMRTTRSAYSALEGGERRTTRPERYFGDCLSTEAVMATAGRRWQQALPG